MLLSQQTETQIKEMILERPKCVKVTKVKEENKDEAYVVEIRHRRDL